MNKLLLGSLVLLSSSSYAAPDYDAALQAVEQEPKVRSAEWLDQKTGSILAGVWDDGTRRDGYAEYLCLVLSDHGIRGGRVRIMDEGAALRGEWKELANQRCPK